jgi:hypothetical protein
MAQEKTNIWKDFARETDGKFIKGYSWRSDMTEIDYNNWKIIFDNYILWSGKYSQKFTRIVVPFVSLDNFRFEIYDNSIVRTIEKIFGAQDIEIGRPEFDKAFVIKANNEFKIKSLLQNHKIRNLIEVQKEINIEVSDQKGIWEEKLPEKEFELSYFIEGEIKDVEELKLLLSLFKEMLDVLYQMKSIDYMKLTIN